MKKIVTSPNKGESGYTLMELLVVLAILGLLTAIATPMVLRYLDSAKLSTAKTEMANLEAGLDLFKYDVGRYPTTQEGLQALITVSAGAENWNGPYIKKSTGVTDPWGHSYNFHSPGEHGDYDLYSNGPNNAGEHGGAKPAIANW